MLTPSSVVIFRRDDQRQLILSNDHLEFMHILALVLSIRNDEGKSFRFAEGRRVVSASVSSLRWLAVPQSEVLWEASQFYGTAQFAVKGPVRCFAIVHLQIV